MKDKYFIDLTLIEVEKAIQEDMDTQNESNDVISAFKGTEIIELPYKPPVIIEKPKGRKLYGVRYC
jgi:hypothetical protein